MLEVLAIDGGRDPRITRALSIRELDTTVIAPDAALERWSRSTPDLLVVDLTDSDAQRVWSELRSQVLRLGIPVLVILDAAALADEMGEPLKGDFVVASADWLQIEIRLRVQRLVRMHLAHRASELICIGELRIDPEGHEVRLCGQIVELTYQEFLVLAYLAAHRGKVHTRQQLLTRVWGYNDMGGSRTVDIHIRRIRSKLGPLYGACIQTVRHVGYKFTQEKPR